MLDLWAEAPIGLCKSRSLHKPYEPVWASHSSGKTQIAGVRVYNECGAYRDAFWNFYV